MHPRPHALTLAFVLALTVVCRAAGETKVAAERITFAAGASAAKVKGEITGAEARDYLVAATIGQTMAVTLTSKNRFAHFDVLELGSLAVIPTHPAPRATTAWTGPAPASGDYVVRVSLRRPEARGPDVAAYTLSITITGSAVDTGASDVIPKQVTYVCDNSTDLVATYIIGDRGSARVAIKGTTWNLPHVLSGSGAKYSDGTVTFWSKGNQAMFEAPGTTFNCSAK